jgi:hypothetical protein
MDDKTAKLIALTFTEASDIVKDRLDNLQAILTHLDPEGFKPCTSTKRGYGFDSIHLDTYNRYAEKVSYLLYYFPAYFFVNSYPRVTVLLQMFTPIFSTRRVVDIPTTISVQLTLQRRSKSDPNIPSLSQMPLKTFAE